MVTKSEQQHGVLSGLVPSAQQLINRGNNLLVMGMLAIIGIDELTAVGVEGGIKGAIDESVIAVVGLGALAWYWRNRYRRRLLPLPFIAADLVFKVMALLIEDPDDRGD